MKRLILSIAIMCCIFVLTFLSAYDFYSMKNYLIANLTTMEEYVYQKDFEKASAIAEETLKAWNADEKHTLRYLNHRDIDVVTEKLARMPNMLLYHGSIGEALGDINSLKHHLEHVWESELPYLRNLL